MNPQQAKKLIRETFENPFDKDRFERFIRELLNRIEFTPLTRYQGNYIFRPFQQCIQQMERIGKYKDPGGKEIDVLVVYLKKGTSLDRARTVQRNYIAQYLNGSRGGVLKNAALVAFVSPNQEDWRFSLVKMEYTITRTSKGNIKAGEEFTPARRFSFLVGSHENSHTAQSQLLPILKDDQRGPALSDLEEAFGIERVTKEFFFNYRELFCQVKEALDELLKKIDVKIVDMVFLKLFQIIFEFLKENFVF